MDISQFVYTDPLYGYRIFFTGLGSCKYDCYEHSCGSICITIHLVYNYLKERKAGLHVNVRIQILMTVLFKVERVNVYQCMGKM